MVIETVSEAEKHNWFYFWWPPRATLWHRHCLRVQGLTTAGSSAILFHVLSLRNCNIVLVAKQLTLLFIKGEIYHKES